MKPKRLTPEAFARAMRRLLRRLPDGYELYPDGDQLKLEPADDFWDPSSRDAWLDCGRLTHSGDPEL